MDNNKKTIDELSRERDIINKNLQKASSATLKQINLVRIQEQTKKTLEQDISMFKEEASKQRKIIYALERERDKYVSEATEIQDAVSQGLEEIKLSKCFYFLFHHLYLNYRRNSNI